MSNAAEQENHCAANGGEQEPKETKNGASDATFLVQALETVGLWEYV